MIVEIRDLTLRLPTSHQYDREPDGTQQCPHQSDNLDENHFVKTPPKRYW
jgi:hypothetical protein